MSKQLREIGALLVVISCLSLAVVLFNTGIVKIETQRTILQVMDASLLNETGIIDVVITLDTPPGAMATIQSQDVFAQSVQALGGVVRDTVVYSDNAVRVMIDAQKLPELAKTPNVKSIVKNTVIWQVPQQAEMEMLTQRTLDRYTLLNVPPLWEMGLTGKDIVVAVVDTGINSELPIFKRNGESIIIDKYILYSEYVMWHGTAVASCIASQDEYIKGVAPGVYLLNVEVFTPSGSAMLFDIKKGWDWVAKWKIEHPDKIVICCNSLGAPPIGLTGGWASPGVLDAQANNLVRIYNIPMIVAAGNGNPNIPSSMLVNSPGQAQYVLTVGAINYDGSIAPFSCRGGTLDGKRKPDVVAPGVNIETFNEKGERIIVSGTSFSTPLTAGVVALLAEKYINYSATQLQDAIKKSANRQLIKTTSVSYDTTYGYGLVDAKSSYVTLATENPAKPVSVSYTLSLPVILLVIGLIFLFYSRRKR